MGLFRASRGGWISNTAALDPSIRYVLVLESTPGIGFFGQVFGEATTMFFHFQTSGPWFPSVDELLECHIFEDTYTIDRCGVVPRSMLPTTWVII